MTVSYRHNGGPAIDEPRSPFGPNGWVAIGRDIRYHAIVGFGKTVKPCDPERGFCYSRGEAWIDLMMECRYSSGQVYNGGRVMTIHRGQLVGATSWLANRWNWTPKTVRHFLESIEAAEMININSPGVEKPANRAHSQGADMGSPDTGTQKGKQKGKQSQVISICNYDIYQLSWLLKGQADGQADGQERGEQGASKGQARGNIYKEEQGNNGTLDLEKQSFARATVAQPSGPDGARPGEEEVHPGVYVNCETVRHAKFVIPLKSLAMALALSNIGVSKNEADDLARQHSIVAAIDWAERLKAGQRPPIDNPVNVIKGSILAARRSEQAAKDRQSKGYGGRPSYTKSGLRRTDGAEFLAAAARIESEESDVIDGQFKVINP